jgi:hypothetical protein
MTTYTSVFGTETIPPSDNAYSVYTLTADTTFFWPEAASGTNLIADIMDLSCASPYSILMPDATLVSTGRAIVIINSGASTITYKDFGGNVKGTILSGNSKCIVLTDNSTQNGSWTDFLFGSLSATVNPATLNGYGLLVTGSTLSQQYTTRTVTTTTSVTTADRSGVVIFNASGVVNANLLQASSATDGFFAHIANQGTGNVIIDPNSTETIDGATTKTLVPGESLTIISTGTAWVTVGYGRSTQFQFTKLVLDVTTGTPFTLTSTQAENKLIQFIGILSAPATVILPAVVAVYYLECAYTGAFSVTIKTATGAGVSVALNERAIVYCDGVDVVFAQTSSVPATVLAGGVAGAVVYQTAPSNTGFTAPGTTGDILVSGGTGSPTWSAGTGTGVPVRATNAVLTTPTLGVASATTINKVTFTTPATGSTLTIVNGKTLTANNTLTFSGTDGSTLNIGTGGTLGTAAYGTIGTTVQAYDADLTTWAGITPGANVGTALAVPVGTAGAFVVNGGALGTPLTGTLTNCTGTAAGLTAGTASAVAVGGVTGLGTGVATFLATPTSANLKAAITDENGASGKAIFADGTLAITAAKTLTATNTLTLSGTDGTTMTFPGTSATLARTDAANTFTGTQAFGTLTATTVNGHTFTAGSSTFTGTAAAVYTFPSASATMAGLGIAQTFTAPQRGTLTTDNDLSFDLSVTNNFFCTTSGNGTLTFTNHSSGQSGFILLVNAGNHQITAAATTKCDSSFLSIISVTGTYLISYFDNGTNAYCVASRALL